MKNNMKNWFVFTLVSVGIFLPVKKTVWADAWGLSDGYVEGVVQLSNTYDTLVWNTANSEDWLLHAEADVYHMHPPLSHNYDVDSELWDPAGDGFVSIGPVTTGCTAQVDWVEAGIGAKPFVDVASVYSSAHDFPASYSDAAGLGQHDNLFWISYNGPDEPPESTVVTISLEGFWFLEGNSDPDDNWFADWYAYAEVYEAPTLTIKGSDHEYHSLGGPGHDIGGDDVDIEFDVTLEYNTSYALRFYMDCESHAQAVPEPGMLLLLSLGGFVIFRKNRIR